MRNFTPWYCILVLVHTYFTPKKLQELFPLLIFFIGKFLLCQYQLASRVLFFSCRSDVSNHPSALLIIFLYPAVHIKFCVNYSYEINWGDRHSSWPSGFFSLIFNFYPCPWSLLGLSKKKPTVINKKVLVTVQLCCMLHCATLLSSHFQWWFYLYLHCLRYSWSVSDWNLFLRKMFWTSA